MTVAEENPRSQFRLIRGWQCLGADDGAAIVAFWQRESAIVDEKRGLARLSEVVLHARNTAGEIVAVCTAYANTPPNFGQPMYHYRCFIGRAWRTTRLVFIMLRAAQECLEEYARAHDFPCIGILIELENPRFLDVSNDAISKLRKPVWTRSGFTYIGKSAQGLDLRAYYFDGAQLKSVVRKSPAIT